MGEETLRDRSGKLLGKIKDMNNGKEVRDSSGRKLGSYNKKSNDTRDSNGRLIGKGNLLSSFLR